MLASALAEKARRRSAARITSNPLDNLFECQRAVISDPEPFKTLLCGRRSGKTICALSDFVAGMHSDAGSTGLYVGVSRPSAKAIFWRPLRELNDRYDWRLKLNESEAIARAPNGSELYVRGMDDIRELEKMRGWALDKIRIDECGAQRPSYLKYLIDEVLEATTMDRGGDVWLMGTPTPQAYGYFYEACTGRLPGWSRHGWTAKDNPHVDFEAFKKRLFARRKWDDSNPIWRREYLAQWIVDSARRVFQYAPNRNLASALPELSIGDKWAHTIAFDFGYGDACAWAVIAYPERWGSDAYVVHAGKKHGLVPSDFAYWMKALIDHFDPDSVVGDVGGLGKAYAVEFLKRWPDIPIRPAKKADKRGALEMTSDALHTGRLRLLTAFEPIVVKLDNGQQLPLEGDDSLQQQWATLVWDEERKDIAEGQDDDTADAGLYAYRECPAYDNPEARPPAPTVPRHVQEDRGEWEPPQPRYNDAPDM